MPIEQYVKPESELLELAERLSAMAKQYSNTVFRYNQTVFDIFFADQGRKNVNQYSLTSTYNVENIADHVYSTIRGEELFLHNIDEFETWRERNEMHYVFASKGIQLPTDHVIDIRPIPASFNRWDDDLAAFTREYRTERITREFGVEQRIIANSEGGVVIESRPFLCIYYRQGYEPHMVTRTIGAYVSSDDDIERLTRLIELMPDPTPDGRIRESGSFTDAFARLHAISNRIEYPTLDRAGLSDHLTHNVVMLSGVSVHEIFGHQFEEPIHPLQVGMQSLFPIGKNVQNDNLILGDDPLRTLHGLEVMGSYRFDSYGRKASPKVHIRDSRVAEHLGGEYIDQKNLASFLGVERSDSIGNSRQGDDGQFPQPRMSCTVLEGVREEQLDWGGSLLMVPFNGYVLDGNFFKVMASECYVLDGGGEPRRVGPLEGSRAIYDAIMGMHVLPGKSYHTGSCYKPSVLDDQIDAEVNVSFLTNHQLWEHLTLRSM